ncbi:MAG: glycosyltransferase family 2 protein [Flavobacteriales bacterium]|nr:glycosyltransferase family 2 protein [Flavobacteriales bacterium]
MKLSVVIITFNEEKNIERCLLSVQDLADEVLVVDSFSKDKTLAICEKYQARVIQNPFEGHIQQKNFAMNQAAYDWILSLDADEALSEELAAAIKQVKSAEKPEVNLYEMNRLTNYCGAWVKHCGWYPDTKIRFVNRKFAKWGGVNPHDKLEGIKKEKIEFLKGDILHYSYYTKEDHLKQIEYFSKIAAGELVKQGKNVGHFTIYLKMAAQFFKSFVLKKGFLDGKTGWQISKLSAFATYRKYSLLRTLNETR